MRRLFVDCGFFAVLCSVLVPAVALAAEPSAPPTGYGAMLFQLVLVVAGVCGFAYLILRFGLKRLVAPDRTGGMMEVVARLPVEPRRSILVVRIGDQHLVVGTSEAGFTRLAELDDWSPSEVAATQPERRSFREILQQGGAEEPLEEAS